MTASTWSERPSEEGHNIVDRTLVTQRRGGSHPVQSPVAQRPAAEGAAARTRLGISGRRWAQLVAALLLAGAGLFAGAGESAAQEAVPGLLEIEDDSQSSRRGTVSSGVQPRSSTRVTCSVASDDFAIFCTAFAMATENFVDEVDVSELAAQAAIGVRGAGLADRTSGVPPACALPAPEFEEMCSAIDAVMDTAAAARAAADQMLVSLDEPRTHLLTAAEYQAFESQLDSDNARVGLGVDYALLDGDTPCTAVSTSCRPVILEVYGGGPAATAGLLAGDVLVSLDGSLPSGLACGTVTDLDDGFTSGTAVSVSVLRAGTTHTYQVTAGNVDEPFVHSRTVDGNIGYIRLAAFASGASATFQSHLSDLIDSGIDALVVDLRDNPGGYLSIARLISGLFQTEGQTIYRLESVHSTRTSLAPSDGLASDAVSLPMAVAINGGSASASELFSLGIRGNDRGLLVGATTYGKSTGQITRDVRASDGTLLAAVRVTTFRFFGPGGLSSAGGISPDVEMSLPECLHPVGVVREAVVPLYPQVVSVGVTSTPDAAAYKTDDKITVGVTFDTPVAVDTTDGTPYISLQIGSNTRQAAYASTTTADGASVATFEYTVASDSDHDGVSFAANSVDLNGGTIRHAAGWDAVLDHDAVPADPYQPVSDDDLPSLTVADIAVGEDASAATFTVTLSEQSTNTVTVDYTTRDGTAAGGAGQDFAPASATLTYSPGDTTMTVAVTVSDDAVDEFDETFDLVLSGSSNALIGRVAAVATIADNDDEAVVSVSGSDVSEADSEAEFTVSLNGSTAKPVEVAYETTAITAEAGADYTPASGTLRFDPGETGAKTIEVALIGDAVYEGAEEFRLDLLSAQNATVSSVASSATVSIADDDDPPELSVQGGRASEGSTLEFSVSLSEAGGLTVSVDFATSDGTAVSGEDYRSMSGRLEFAPGDRSKTVSVAVLTDQSEESEESVWLSLSNAENASIANPSATGLITDRRAVSTPTPTPGPGAGAGPRPVPVPEPVPEPEPEPEPLQARPELLDIELAGVHGDNVRALWQDGTLDGLECEPNRYCANETVLRWEIAVMLVRTVDGEDPDGVTEVRFADVDPTQWWAAHVERLAELEITLGCTAEPAQFCPDGPVTRAQMASFLSRAFKLPPAEPAGFADIHGGVHAPAIDALFASGITTGCTTDPLRYCPGRHTTRAQMASFLNRARTDSDA